MPAILIIGGLAASFVMETNLNEKKNGESSPKHIENMVDESRVVEIDNGGNKENEVLTLENYTIL